MIIDPRASAPRLQWFHQLPAGAGNLHPGDLWGSNVIITTSPICPIFFIGLTKEIPFHKLNNREQRPGYLKMKGRVLR
jgi:hypothetical protein